MQLFSQFLLLTCSRQGICYKSLVLVLYFIAVFIFSLVAQSLCWIQVCIILYNLVEKGYDRLKKFHKNVWLCQACTRATLPCCKRFGNGNVQSVEFWKPQVVPSTFSFHKGKKNIFRILLSFPLKLVFWKTIYKRRKCCELFFFPSQVKRL